MNNIILCPKCGNLANWNSYFQKYICSSDFEKCDWIGIVPKENIKQMRERHTNEIEELQNICTHTNISECMPYMWRIGAISHCVKICIFCEKEMFTTAVKQVSKPFQSKSNSSKEELFEEMKKSEYEPKFEKPDNWFECPKRKDCDYWNRIK